MTDKRSYTSLKIVYDIVSLLLCASYVFVDKNDLF